ncbi:hypothetical protein BDN70DRAFT_995121 [Pholiota conissans]|uniref:Fungal-type protein kinase domain-containing protein n=1 Tax=Pholiota conissans TaxID=109636 RepID=A0A9P6CZ09_9AGAR|nr:hypothetical protein BDN70DRAFT_995121 [Pholiota conissans]
MATFTGQAQVPPIASSSAAPQNQLSPVKKGTSSVASGNREEVQASLPAEGSEEIVELTVAEFWEELHYNPEDFKQKALYKKKPSRTEFCTYMYNVSTEMHAMVNAAKQIFFVETGTISHPDHPTGSQCRPDFVAVKTEQVIHWSDVEATIEIHSEGATRTTGPRQAMAYAYFLLQARPDRISVPGMYVDDEGVMLFLVSCTKIKRTHRLKLKDAASTQLLYAFVKRMYEPHPLMVDSTIKKDRDSEGRVVFDIRLNIPHSPKPVVCCGYKITNVGSSRGQRTHIFVNTLNPTEVNGQPILVIKDQYRRRGPRFTEREVIEQIHHEGEVPGIIRIVHAEEVARDDGSSVVSDQRYKTRLCMMDYGLSIMELETPKEVLMAIYDLLEVTRFIYFKHHVLHRDISQGNVLFKKRSAQTLLIESAKEKNASTVPPSAEKDEAKPQLCFVEHLLYPNVDKRQTSVLLVDFDRGEILNRNRHLPHSERTGTILFMAKAVRQNEPHGTYGEAITYKNVPKVTEQARIAYEAIHTDRLIRFPDSTPRHSLDVGVADLTKFRHQLYHDAESAFWLLMRWALLAFPAGHTPTEVRAGLWYNLNDTDSDDRPFRIRPGALDPSYSALEGLLIALGIVLERDIHWATEEPYTYPDFIHEVFQRHLLNFIVENQDKEFMNLRRASSFRKPDSTGFVQRVPLTHPEVENLRVKTLRTAHSRSQSVSSAPMDDLPSSSLPPPPPSSRPRTRSMAGASAVPPSGPVTRNASDLSTASSGASSIRTQSSTASKRSREAEGSEPRAGSSKKAKKGKKSQTATASTSSKKSTKKRK